MMNTRKQLGLVQEAKSLAAQMDKNPLLKLDPNFQNSVRVVASQLQAGAMGAEGGKSKLGKDAIELAERMTAGDIGAISNFGRSAGLATYEANLNGEARATVDQYSRGELQEQHYVDMSQKNPTRQYGFVQKTNGPNIRPDLAGKQEGE
jgi:hypothetical protein